jgi:two-component system, NarL family, response regulator DevR
VFIVDDHEIVRRGLIELLSAEPDIEVVGEAGTVPAALARVPAVQPDVAVLDVRIGDGDGVSLCREIRSMLPGTASLMLTAFGDDRALLGAIMAGAAGYITKQSAGTELVSAIRTVAAGGYMLDAHATEQVLRRLREGQGDAADPTAALTSQERRVLDLIGQGLTNRQIADQMFLSENTTKNYVAAVLSKLGMHHRSQAAALAARLSEQRRPD